MAAGFGFGFAFLILFPAKKIKKTVKSIVYQAANITLPLIGSVEPDGTAQVSGRSSVAADRSNWKCGSILRKDNPPGGQIDDWLIRFHFLVGVSTKVSQDGVDNVLRNHWSEVVVNGSEMCAHVFGLLDADLDYWSSKG
jgi:hypothetical protein